MLDALYLALVDANRVSYGTNRVERTSVSFSFNLILQEEHYDIHI